MVENFNAISWTKSRILLYLCKVVRDAAGIPATGKTNRIYREQHIRIEKGLLTGSSIFLNLIA